MPGRLRYDGSACGVDQTTPGGAQSIPYPAASHALREKGILRSMHRAQYPYRTSRPRWATTRIAVSGASAAMRRAGSRTSPASSTACRRTSRPVWSTCRALVQRSSSRSRGRGRDAWIGMCSSCSPNTHRGAVGPSAIHRGARADSCTTLSLPVILT
jgi:hypothetical protein